MKLLIAVIAGVLLLSGCTSKTEYGACIGAFDDKDPNLIYKVDASNVVIAIVFSELIAPPVYVIMDETLCPVGRKPNTQGTK